MPKPPSNPIWHLRHAIAERLRPDISHRAAIAAIAAVVAAASAVSGCGDGGSDDTSTHADEAERPAHIHGLGVNPADEALFIATHSGLFRSPKGTTDVERVGEQRQDTMGFTVVGPDHFLASGHPGPGEGGPPNLGLIESSDAGRSWTQVSLAGQADFHVLRYAHQRIYAYNGLTGELMLSDDGGESWVTRQTPAAIVDLAVDPADQNRILASTDRGLALSGDDGRTWRGVRGEIGLLAWAAPDRVYLIDADGEVRTSESPGTAWRVVGSIDGRPAAFVAADVEELHAGLGDGTVLTSVDGGAKWNMRAAP